MSLENTLKKMAMQDIEFYAVRTVVAHPYPEMAGNESSYILAIYADGTVRCDGWPITDKAEIERLLKESQTYQQQKVKTRKTQHSQKQSAAS